MANSLNPIQRNGDFDMSNDDVQTYRVADLRERHDQLEHKHESLIRKVDTEQAKLIELQTKYKNTEAQLRELQEKQTTLTETVSTKAAELSKVEADTVAIEARLKKNENIAVWIQRLAITSFIGAVIGITLAAYKGANLP